MKNKRYTTPRGELPLAMFYRIGDISRWLDVPPSVLRYWEEEFAAFLPVERSKKGQRVYNRQQAVKLGVIKHLLYIELYTIAGAKRQLRLAAERERQAQDEPQDCLEAPCGSEGKEKSEAQHLQ